MQTSNSQYYTLITSLPYLPRFDMAKRLPINREQLEMRLSMLEEEDAETLKIAERLLLWHHQPMEHLDAEVLQHYRYAQATSDNAVLHALIRFRLNLRTILSAMRQRHFDKSYPRGRPWGGGDWIRYIEEHWHNPCFSLENIFPWLQEVDHLLKTGDALALEKFLLGLTWDHLQSLAEPQGFGFDVVLVYLFHWDITQRWLVYNTATAETRFEQLITETVGDYEQLFD